MSEEQSRDDHKQSEISRRQLLKALAATGGAVAVSSLLPDEWSNPVVDVGALPAHAQISETPVPGLIITTCHMANADGSTEIYPTSTIELYAVIRTERSDIEAIPLVMTLEVLRVGETNREPLNQCSGTASIEPWNGPNEATFRCPDYDLTNHQLSPDGTLIATWTFQNPEDSEDECSLALLISPEQQPFD